MKHQHFIFSGLGRIVFVMVLSCCFSSCQIYYRTYLGLRKAAIRKIHSGECFSRREMYGISQEIYKGKYPKSKISATVYPYFLSDIQSSCLGLYYYEGYPGEGIRCPCPVIPVLRLTDTYEVWTGDSLTDRRVVDTFLQTYKAYFSEVQGKAIAYIFVRGRTHINWEKFLLGEGE